MRQSHILRAAARLKFTGHYLWRIINFRNAISAKTELLHFLPNRMHAAWHHRNHIATGLCEREHFFKRPLPLLIVKKMLDDSHVEHKIIQTARSLILQEIPGNEFDGKLRAAKTRDLLYVLPCTIQYLRRNI